MHMCKRHIKCIYIYTYMQTYIHTYIHSYMHTVKSLPFTCALGPQHVPTILPHFAAGEGLQPVAGGTA